MKNKNKNKDTGFRVPDSYFEDFEANLLDKMNQEEIDVHSKIKDTNGGFKVPDGYFDTLERTIMSKVQVEEKTVKVIPLRLWSKVAAIASIAALFIVIFLLRQQPTSTSYPEESIDLAVLETYITSDDFDYTMVELEDYFDNEGIVFDNSYTNSIQVDEIYNYLDENIESEFFLTE